MISAGATAVRRAIAALLDVPDANWPPLRPAHHKLGTSQNEEFSARFRETDPEFIKQIDAERAPMLLRLLTLSETDEVKRAP
jgi:hypothetical protein